MLRHCQPGVSLPHACARRNMDLPVRHARDERTRVNERVVFGLLPIGAPAAQTL